MRTLLALMVVSLIALGTACSEGIDQDAPTDAGPTQEELLQAALQRLTDLKREPWLGTVLSIREPLIDLHARLHNWSSGGSEDPAALLSRSKALEPLLGVIDQVGPVANRVWRAERGCLTTLAQLAIPDETPFPLRTRLREGWLKDRATHFGFLVRGLQALREGRTDDSLKIGAGNLSRIADEGEKLHGELTALARNIQALDTSLKRLEQVKIPWGKKILAAANRAESRITQDEIEALRTAIDRAAAALPKLRTDWTPLRLRAVSAPESTRPEVIALMGQANALGAAIYRVGNPLAVRLRLVNFQRGG